MSGDSVIHAKVQKSASLLSAFRIEPSSKREASFAFSSKTPDPGWIAYSYEAALPFLLKGTHTTVNPVDCKFQS